MLQIRGLTRKFERNGALFPAVDKAELSVKDGDCVQIIGRSGSGKTTFLNLITGLLSPDEGQIVLSGQDIAAMDDTARAKLRNSLIGYIPQGNSLLDNFTVLDNVRLPHYLADSGSGDVTARAEKLLEEAGAGHLKNAYPYQLSGGEQRRVAIARALINSPKFIIADEPTSDLDVASVRTVVELLRKIHAEGRTLLIVTHELDAVDTAERVLIMQDGVLKEITSRDLKKEDLVSRLSVC